MVNIFDRKLLKLKRNRAAKNFSENDFIFKEVDQRICERTEELRLSGNSVLNISNLDEDKLEFEQNSFDLIISNMNLHFINDIENFLLKIKNFLKKDGVFIASFFGGETLKELRQILFEVEQKKFGGVSPRIAPFIHVKDAGMLMQKAGFKDVVSDSEIIEVQYSNFFKLLHDLRNMAQSNIMIDRSKKYVGKDFFKEAEKLYPKENGQLEANFEIITIVGWKA